MTDLELPRITIEFEGTVLSAVDTVGWAARGYNPTNRHAKSYFPLLCHIAQTGHFVRAQNRHENVHDGKRLDDLADDKWGKVTGMIAFINKSNCTISEVMHVADVPRATLTRYCVKLAQAVLNFSTTGSHASKGEPTKQISDSIKH